MVVRFLRVKLAVRGLVVPSGSETAARRSMSPRPRVVGVVAVQSVAGLVVRVVGVLGVWS